MPELTFEGGEPSVVLPEWVEISNRIRSEDEKLTKGTFTARDNRDEKIIATMRYELYHSYNKVAKIAYLGVVVQCRNQGLASALVEALHTTYPDYAIDPGASLTPGAEGLRSYIMSVPGVSQILPAASIVVGP